MKINLHIAIHALESIECLSLPNNVDKRITELRRELEKELHKILEEERLQKLNENN